MSPVGRRPGKLSARDDIIRAARVTFAERGYDGTSLRAVARTAGVDAALIHHYFDGKAGLFMAAMTLPCEVQPDADTGPPAVLRSWAALVEEFLAMWDLAQGTGSSFVSCVGAMAASPDVADAVRDFVQTRVSPHLTPFAGEDADTTDARRALVASQLMGLAYTRYVLRVPPISTASPSQIGHWVGPTLERYGGGDLGLSDSSERRD
jgi:AcrR family transcriptional regulator